MAFPTTWPDFTEAEVQKTVERDFDRAEVGAVLDALSSWDSPHLRMVILCKVRGREDLISQYKKWDWKRPALLRPATLSLWRFVHHRPV